MKIKELLSDGRRSSKKRRGDDRLKLSGRAWEGVGPGEGMLAAIMGAARIATEEAIKRRKASEEELFRWRKAAGEETVRIITEEKAEEETAGIASEERAAEKPAEEETAEEKAARKAAKRQKAAEEAARWVAEAVRALGDSVELNDEDALTAAQNLCEALEWKFLKNLTGCQIEYGMEEDFSDSKKEKIRRSDDLGELEKKLEAGKKYYVRLRLCATVKDKKRCSDWTELFTLKA